MTSRSLAGALLAGWIASPVAAQPPALGLPAGVLESSKDIAGELGKVQAAMLDLSVPDSPAFTVLRLTPEEVSRPTTVRKLATSLLNGVDRHGVLQSGVAVDVAPYLAVAGEALQLSDYRGRYGVRFLSRLQTSVATVKASGDNDKATRAAVGVRATLLDQGDPRTDQDLEACFDKRPTLPPPPKFIVPPMPADPTPEQAAEWAVLLKRGLEEEQKFNAAVDTYVERVRVAVDACREEARARNWNNTSWIVAFATAWTSETGALGDLGSTSGGAWTTFAYGFEGYPVLDRSAQLLLHARARSNEQVAQPGDDAPLLTRDAWLLGLQFRMGTPNSNVALEALFDRTRPEGGSAANSRRFALGYEQRIAANLWLGVAVGGQAPAPEGAPQSGSFVLSSFKWGFAERQTLGTP